jgi:signal peptide peptidase-like 2B
MTYPIDSLELNAGHAIGFMVMASSGLLILFFFKVWLIYLVNSPSCNFLNRFLRFTSLQIYIIVKIFYAFGCSKAVAQVIFYPLCTHMARKFLFSDCVVLHTEDFGDITLLDVVSFAFGYTWGLSWLCVAFFVWHPESITFYWATQDVMGSFMCIMFLSAIKLISIRVATLLLLVAFFYDIFSLSSWRR